MQVLLQEHRANSRWLLNLPRPYFSCVFLDQGDGSKINAMSSYEYSILNTEGSQESLLKYRLLGPASRNSGSLGQESVPMLHF